MKYNTLGDSPKKFLTGCCRICKHFHGEDKGTCPAYPNGIPDRFSTYLEPHLEIEKDQRGDFIWISTLS
jgi:hypothetical protein